MSSVTVEKPKLSRTGVYQVRASGKVGILGNEQPSQIYLYLLGEGAGTGAWYTKMEVDELPPGSSLLVIL